MKRKRGKKRREGENEYYRQANPRKPFTSNFPMRKVWVMTRPS